jgi:hypothetical protein
MNDETTRTIESLLAQTEEAHGVYESAELGGVYDQQWSRWYAEYAVGHGIADLIGHEVAADRLATLLADSFADYERTDPRPSASWTAYLAEQIAAKL